MTSAVLTTTPPEASPKPDELRSLSEYARASGLQSLVIGISKDPNAKVTGKDSIDFGDGAGDIDVLTSEGAWWWGPKN